jgi:hypothetical protein
MHPGALPAVSGGHSRSIQGTTGRGVVLAGTSCTRQLGGRLRVEVAQPDFIAVSRRVEGGWIHERIGGDWGEGEWAESPVGGVVRVV